MPDWYADVAPEAYQELYRACCDDIGVDGLDLPADVAELDAGHREALKPLLRGRSWPGAVDRTYREFSHAVALRSVERWKASLTDARAREEMVWRLLRLQAAPYFVLGRAQMPAYGHTQRPSLALAPRTPAPQRRSATGYQPSGTGHAPTARRGARDATQARMPSARV